MNLNSERVVMLVIILLGVLAIAFGGAAVYLAAISKEYNAFLIVGGGAVTAIGALLASTNTKKGDAPTGSTADPVNTQIVNTAADSVPVVAGQEPLA